MIETHIEKLQQEAMRAGDGEQADLCRAALRGDDEAIAACVRVLDEALEKLVDEVFAGLGETGEVKVTDRGLFSRREENCGWCYEGDPYDDVRARELVDAAFLARACGVER